MSRSTTAQIVRAFLVSLGLACLALLVAAPTPVALAQALDDGGVLFVENVGQFDPAVRFVALTADGPVWLTDDALWLTVAPPAVAEFPDQPPARPAQAPVALRVRLSASVLGVPYAPSVSADTRVSFLRGAGEDAWRADVPVWSQLTRHDFMPGLDLHFTGDRGRLALSLVPAAAAVTSAALDELRLSVDGADGLAVTADALIMQTPNGPARLPLLHLRDAPTLAQAQAHVDGFTVHAPFAAATDHAAAAPALQPDAAQDESLLFSTFLGSGDQDQIFDIARATDGTIVATGLTRSLLFPTTPGVVDPTYNGSDDAFVAKFSADGSQLLYATFLGGSGSDYGYNVAVDSTDRVYVAGRTASTDFPTKAAYDPTANGSEDLFLARLSGDGTTVDFSTYLGGSGLDWGYGLTVDATGAVAMAGLTESPDFPVTAGALDGSLSGPTDGFLLRFQPGATALDFATFIGGSERDRVYGMTTDDAGAFYLSGRTESPDFPVTSGAYDTSYNGGGVYFGDTVGDVFVAKVSRGGDELRYATYLGGSSYDGYFTRLAVSADGEAVVTGLTGSANFPTTLGVVDDTANGGADLFVTRLNALGSGLVFSTYLGGSQDEQGNAVALDARGDAVITGWTRSANFPTTPDALDPAYDTDLDGFVAKLTADGTELMHGTYLGGIGLDTLNVVLTGEGGLTYVAGWSESSNFPATPDAYDRFHNGDRDGVVTLLDLPARDEGPQSFSLFGSVVDTSGAGLADITVRVGAATATTDADGVFVLRDLPAGVYPVTPQHAGTRFTPATVSASLVPNQPSRVYTFLALEDAQPPELALQWPLAPSAGGAHGQRTDARVGGAVGAWFDHRYPTQARTDDLMLWDGVLRDDLSAPRCFDERCADGLDGLEISYRDPDPATTAAEPLTVYPAAPGTVTAIERDCVVGATACGGAEGNHVVLTHDGGLFTRYARLATVTASPALTVGMNVSVTVPLGEMGATGRSGSTFLLFTVHRDNGNGRWDGDLLDKPLDPFGWFGTEPDPWVRERAGPLSAWLWMTPAYVTATVSADSVTLLAAPTGAMTVTVPAAALNGDATVRLFPGFHPAPPDPAMRSTGLAFALEPTDWVGDPATQAATPAAAATLTVTAPLQLRADLSDGELAHVNAAALAFHLWDPVAQRWSPVETTVANGVATATTAQGLDAFGAYDLQAPLLCPADHAEPDDGPYLAYVIPDDLTEDAVSVAGRFDTAGDADWLRFDADAGATYAFLVADVAADVRMDVAVFGRDGLTLLDAVTSETDGESVELLWQAPANGAYFLRLRQAGTGAGCDSGYVLLAGSDDRAPRVQILAPGNNALLTVRQPEISARVTDDGTGVADVTMTLNGEMVPAVVILETGDVSYTPPSPLELGEYTVAVSATDRAGNQGQASVRFRVAELSFVYLPLASR